VSYQVFARKYRPRTFADVLGQDHVVQTLRNAIEQQRLAHAYLFVGPRGTGKTSTARILAKALNCTGGPKIDFDPDEDVCIEIAEGRSLDVLEIDGASNNGVEQVRDLRETVKYAPTRGHFKIYYIDEVHMLSNAAFNALLKTLEEPPAHVKFIFATTEPTKILPTIISRCQRFDLRRIPTKIISDHLLHIADVEGIRLDPMAAHAIAKGSEGGMRDAQSMLDQLVAFCGEQIREADVLDIFGFTAHETVSKLAGAILERNTVAALEAVYEQSESGKDLTKFLQDLIGHLRTLLVCAVDPANATSDLAPELAESYMAQSRQTTVEKLLALIDYLAVVDGRMKWAPNKRLHFEIAVIKAVQEIESASLSDVLNVLNGALEGQSVAPLPVARPVPVSEPRASAARPAAIPVVAPPERPAPAPAARPSAPPRAEEAPPTRKPAPAPAPKPIPVVEAAPRPVAKIDGAAIWTSVVEQLQHDKPIAAAYALKAQYISVNDRHLVIGVPKEEDHARNALLRDNVRTPIEQLLGKGAGRPLELKVELRSDFAPIELPVEEDEMLPSDDSFTAGEESAMGPTAEDYGERDFDSPSNRPSRPSQADSPTEQVVTAEDFYSDPLIKDALRIFEAEIK
jgi:DNA polymerase-3 subunit gamma/tau